MKIRQIVLLIASACAYLTGCVDDSPSYEEATAAIMNVAIVDVETGKIRKNQAILLNGELILATEPVRKIKQREGLTLVDGKGKYAIPGLWDMHAHLVNDTPPVDWDFDDPVTEDKSLRQTYEPAWVAFGVVGLREMSGGPWSLKMRNRVKSGEIDGPHLVIGSPILDGPYPIFPGDGVRAIANPEEAHAAVKELHDAGYDFLKTYNFLSPESFRALHETAKKLHMDVAGELPLSVSAWEAADLGERSIEHMSGIEISCSSKEEALRAYYAAGVAAIAADPKLNNQVTLWNRSEWEPVASFDAEKCYRLYQHFVEQDVWITPTLVILRRLNYPDIPEVKNNPYVKYITKYDANIQGLIDEYDPERRLRQTYDHRFAAVYDMQQKGVGILAGSDMQGGFWLHEELQIFVDAGLTPLEALQTATINPAKFLKRDDELGSIAPGKYADIVLLNANPLEDISNTINIDAVILKGRLYERSTLDRMLSQVETDARVWEASD